MRKPHIGAEPYGSILAKMWFRGGKFKDGKLTN
jgi:hypothetical protein